MFSPNDIEQICQRGMNLDLISRQINHFIKGFPPATLIRPATPGDGIIVLNDFDRTRWITLFEEEAPHLTIVKFVPASGAASRMFKHLFEFCEKYNADSNGELLFTADQSFNSIHYLISHLDQIAFYHDLCKALENKEKDISGLMKDREYGEILRYILEDYGLNYANLPKGLILFHDYPEGARTSAEEHLVEAACYARDDSGNARIHFTISPEHREKFNELFSRVVPHFESVFNVQFDISYSIQRPETDMIAVDTENNPFRNSDGTLLFRPGGHGALLGNLNSVEADLIFIKNIDNVVPDRLKPTTYDYKKALGGYLLSLRNQVFEFLNRAESGLLEACELDSMITFAKEKLCLFTPPDLLSSNNKEKQAQLINLLNRPIRVCGMVRNEGEPGGGPFWVKGSDGNQSLQIVESAQIETKDPGQAAIMGASTHFNPVDLVCSTVNYKGELFHLQDFVDDETGFISLKSTGGKTLKAQELPGLWNGAMAHWITLFVEVPIVTFNPVKTVNDLLRKEHLGA